MIRPPGLTWASSWPGLASSPRRSRRFYKSIDLETDDHRAEEAGARWKCSSAPGNGSGFGPRRAWLRDADSRSERRHAVPAQLGPEEANSAVSAANQETGVMVGLIVEELSSLLAIGGTTLAASRPSWSSLVGSSG